MALKQPTQASFFRAAYLCWLALVDPLKFAELEQADTGVLEKQPNASPSERVLILRRALFVSLVLVVTSSGIGFVLGWLFGQKFGRSETWIFGLQIVGAMGLLWATLALRGWEIQTFSNATLTERVNQWIYRFLCCLGTGFFLMAVGWDVGS